jgi:hypothetical protein
VWTGPWLREDDVHVWEAGLVVAAAGAAGGIVSAFLSEDRGLPLPTKVPVDGTTVLRPGFVGHVVVGAIASFISWGLYGPLTDQVLIGSNPDGSPPADDFGITAAAVAAATGVGVGGAKFLSNYVDKKLLQATASVAAGKTADPVAAGQLTHAMPTKALDIAQKMVA